MRTEEQIRAEVDALTALKFKVPPTSKFGDDNKAAIDAGIRVLTERMDAAAIDQAFGPADPARTFDDYVYQEAVAAGKWLRGELKDDALAGDWACLVKA